MNKKLIGIAVGFSALMLGAYALDTTSGSTFSKLSDLRTSQSSMFPIVAQTSAAQQATVTTVTDANLAAEVLASGTPVIIDLYADWCGPCRAFAPNFDAAASQYAGKVKFARVDVDVNAKAARFFGVRAIPMVVIVKKDAQGNLVYITKTGYMNASQLKAFIDGAIDPANAGVALPTWK